MQHLSACVGDQQNAAMNNSLRQITGSSLQVCCGRFHESNSSDSAILAEHTPTAVHWGNAPEFQEPREFHSIASCIVPKGTPHFMYLMNWDSDMKGTKIEDYGCYPVETRQRSSEQRADIFSAAVEAAGKQQSAHGLDKFVRGQVVEGQLPICSAYLANKMASAFVRKHAAEAPAGVKATMEVVEAPRYQLFARTEVVMHARLTYA